MGRRQGRTQGWAGAWSDLSGGEKRFVDGAHRIVEPSQTIDRVMPYLGDFGITRVANVTGLDRIGVPVVMVMRPNSRSVAVSQGKGVTLDAARASGLMEAIESWHAERIDRPVVYGRYRDLCRTYGLVSPDILAQVAGFPYTADLRLSWIEGHDLIGGGLRWVPYEMVHTDYTHPVPEGHGCFACSSNGLASGNNLLEATVHAICEVIERDATGLWHHSGGSRQAERRLDLASVDDPRSRHILERIKQAGLDIAVWETTSDVGVPSFYALLAGDEHEHVGEGAGCHPDKAVALSRTLSEAVQTRMTYISGARDDILREEFGVGGMRQKQDMAARLMVAGTPRVDYSGIAGFAGGTLGEDMDALIDRLCAVGIEHVVAIDLSKPQFGIAVVRVIVAGLEAPHDDAGYVPGARARAAMRVRP
jgi:ribosomal protein S12 methylthiotransferase accessory factor